MKTILLNEWRIVSRNRWFLFLGISLAAMLALSSYLGIQETKILSNLEQEASAHIREQWDNQGAGNPHGAAHYGTYLFKPSSSLTGFDEGVNGVVGKTIYLEGHRQNDTQYSEASQSVMATRFGKLRPSLILQLIVPLFLIFMVFSTVRQERESDRIRLLIIQGGDYQGIISGKIFFYWLAGIIFLGISLLVQVLMDTAALDSGTFLRMLLLFVGYSAFYYIICSLTAYLSANLRKTGTALSIMMAVWIIWGVFLPRITGNLAEQFYELPTRSEFSAQMKEDRSAGVDGHNAEDDKIKAIKDSVLRQYQVASVEELPINFNGILMQTDEEFGNKVWDKHFGNLYQVMDRQKTFVQASSIPNPLQSLQSLSMALSGTDQKSHIDFMLKVEDYRRQFIKSLNDKYAFGGSKTGDWEWEADQDFFRSMQDFSYQNRSMDELIGTTWPDVAILLGWVVGCFFLIKSIRFQL